MTAAGGVPTGAERASNGWRRRAAVLLVLFAAAATAFGYAGRESGGLVTKQLDIRGFDRVSVSGSWDVEVGQGRFAVSVTVDAHLEDDLRVERRGATLVLSSARACAFVACERCARP